MCVEKCTLRLMGHTFKTFKNWKTYDTTSKVLSMTKVIVKQGLDYMNNSGSVWCE